WADDEAQADDDGRELRRLFRRARRRPLVTLGLALVLTAGIVGWRARKPPSYESRVVLRVTEGTVQEDASPGMNHDIRAYVHDVAFTKERLRAVMERFDISTSRRKKDPVAAVDDFRED